MALALSDDCLREVMAAAALVPVERRHIHLEAVARELQGEPVVGPGLVHRLAFAVARPHCLGGGARNPTRRVEGSACVGGGPLAD